MFEKALKEEEHLDIAKYPPKLNIARIEVASLTDDELIWYNWLDEDDLKELEKGYFEKVHNRRGPVGRVTYAGFVKTCAAIAVRMHKTQNRRERKNMERLEKLGKRNLGDGKGPKEWE